MGTHGGITFGGDKLPLALLPGQTNNHFDFWHQGENTVCA